jgi:Protein of unknown function (DUF2634).
MNDEESIFPFIELEEDDEEEEDELEELCEYAYDFENNCLLKNESGQNYFVYRNDALRIWIYKVLNTSRYHHLAYTEEFGNENETIIGQTLDIDIAYLEIKRFITEALMNNDYINELSNFNFELNKDKVIVRFTVTSIYDEFEYVAVVDGGDIYG